MKETAYLIQANLIMLWWIGMSFFPDFYQAFQFPGIPSVAFNSFFTPDMFILCLLSLIRAYKKIRELEYIILGGFAFATLYCFHASFLTQGGYISSVLMLLGLFYNLFVVFQNHIFRKSKSQSFKLNILKTILQIICVWFTTLIFLPWLILTAEGKYIEFHNDYFTIIGVLFLTFFSIFGLISAYVMVKYGDGTPLPLDQTNSLVIRGPYSFVRNPMAIAGVGQALAVGFVFHSIPILFYSLFGAVLWHFVVRPLEEKNLVERFGEPYILYQKSVPCWFPIRFF
jgi:protein-S-isoprenylcysteine O-methyltransferase Ste14